MNLRGELYRLAASSLGSGWKACLDKIENDTPPAIEQRALSELLSHAVTHVPHYRELRISDPTLDAFPLLSRETLRTEFEKLKSDDLDRRRWRKSSTGGSTGEPVWVIKDRAFQQWDYATNMYHMDAFCGMPYAEYLRSHRVAIWHRRRRQSSGRLQRLGVQLLGQVMYIEPYESLSDAVVREYVRRINRHKPAVVLTFAGTAYEIARCAQRLGLSLYSPRFVLSSVEMLYPTMRRTIREAFNCPVFNRYGAAEVGHVAAECLHGSFHIFSFNNVVEVVNPDGTPTLPGDVGRIVITSLHNLAMPLIRYDIGDLARVSEQDCSCGNHLPTVGEIRGRVIQHFIKPDGGLVYGGNFVAIFYEHEWVLQFYVLQEEVDRISISYKRTPGCPVPEGAIEALTKRVRDIMGEQCAVIWNEVDVVPASLVGKHLHTRSLVWEEKSRNEVH